MAVENRPTSPFVQLILLFSFSHQKTKILLFSSPPFSPLQLQVPTQISPTCHHHPRREPCTTSLLPPLCSSPDLQTPDLCSGPRPPLARDNPAAARGGRGEMLRLRAFRPTTDKVVKIQLHPTHPWLVTADANDRVSVWDWEHRQVPFASRDSLAIC